jgi:hypothetical protein
MEKIMLTPFCMGQQLHTILSPEFMPPETFHLIAKCDHIFKADIRGTLSNDMLAFDRSLNTEMKVPQKEPGQVRLSKDKVALLETWQSTHPDSYDAPVRLSPYAQHRQSMNRMGEVLSTETTSLPNSLILFRILSGVAAGSI